jgi:hypothetical protein
MNHNFKDYKNKYCKYKEKYLNLKKILEGGMKSEKPDLELKPDPDLEQAPDLEPIIITVTTDTEEKGITALPTDVIYDIIATEFGQPVDKIEEVLFGDNAVEPGQSFELVDIEDGARLSARFRVKATVEEVVADMIRLNPHLTRERLMRNSAFSRVEVDTEDASRVKGHVEWSHKGINVLPESIGDITVGGYLNLSYNRLTTLPQSFGDLTVGSHLFLNDNNLVSLPASFGNLQIGKDVCLWGNPVAASRPRFHGLTIR